MRIVDERNIEKARLAIKRSAERPIILMARDDKFNRKLLEQGGFDAIIGLEKGRQDSVRQLDSGLNHVSARIAARRGIAIGFDLDFIRSLSPKDKARVLARLRQNIMLCRKSGARLALMNFADERDAIHLLMSLGASSSQAKETFLMH